MTLIEAAVRATCDWDNPCKKICDMCKREARATVLAYLRALVEQGPSNAVLDAGLECHGWTPINHWQAMLAAHIEEMEDSQ